MVSAIGLWYRHYTQRIKMSFFDAGKVCSQFV
jgi:hypothetical protein